MAQEYYDCTINGRCQPSPAGRYNSLAECQSTCQGTDNADLLYLMLSYDWGLASTFPLADQQELLRREFNMRVPPREAEHIVGMLRDGNVLQLLRSSDTFAEYLEPNLTDLDFFVLDIIEILSSDIYVYVDWIRVKQMVESWLIVNLGNYVEKEGWANKVDIQLLALLFAMLSWSLPVGIRDYGTVAQERLEDLFLGRYPWLVEEFGQR